MEQFVWEDWNILNLLSFTDSTIFLLFLKPLNGNEVILISLRNLNRVVSLRLMLRTLLNSFHLLNTSLEGKQFF